MNRIKLTTILNDHQLTDKRYFPKKIKKDQ